MRILELTDFNKSGYCRQSLTIQDTIQSNPFISLISGMTGDGLAYSAGSSTSALVGDFRNNYRLNPLQKLALFCAAFSAVARRTQGNTSGRHRNLDGAFAAL